MAEAPGRHFWSPPSGPCPAPGRPPTPRRTSRRARTRPASVPQARSNSRPWPTTPLGRPNRRSTGPGSQAGSGRKARRRPGTGQTRTPAPRPRHPSSPGQGPAQPVRWRVRAGRSRLTYPLRRDVCTGPDALVVGASPGIRPRLQHGMARRRRRDSGKSGRQRGRTQEDWQHVVGWLTAFSVRCRGNGAG